MVRKRSRDGERLGGFREMQQEVDGNGERWDR